MWPNGGGIADNLSRDFRAMSSERDRRWCTAHTSYGTRDSTAPNAYLYGGGRATSPPLRYAVSAPRGRSTYEGYQPIRRYSQNEDSLTRRKGGRNNKDGGLVSYPLRRPSRSAGDHRRDERQNTHGFSQAASYDTRQGYIRSADKYSHFNNNTPYVNGGGDDDSYSYSYSYSSSESDSGTDSISSDGYSDGPQRNNGGGRNRQGTARPVPQRRGSAGTKKRKVRYTPTGPTGTVGVPGNAAENSVVHWVGVDNGDNRNYRNICGDGQQFTNAGQAAATPSAVQRPTAPMPALQPSGLLRRVVESVAYYRGVPIPSAIPSEVTLAFDEYVSRGSTMLKFLHHGPPHSRYFIIRFLDVVPGGRRHGKAGDRREMTMPHAVLAWYRNTSSRHMVRFLPLHDLIEVKADGADHPYVRRRTVQPGVLRGPRTGFSTNYVYADFILQLHFHSRLSRGEETLALKTANRTQHLAWLVFGSFISQVGSGGANHFL